MKSSSKTNGIATARAKGQPTIAPVAKSTVADSVLLEFWADGGARVNAKASVFAYSANDEGKNARKGLAKQLLVMEVLSQTGCGIPHSRTEENHEQEVSTYTEINPLHYLAI